MESQLVDPRVQISSAPLHTLVDGNGDEVNEGSIALRDLSTNRPLLQSETACLVARNAELGWTGRPGVISEASFSIYSQKVTGIVGGPGSGKTTLLESFLGLSTISKGSLSSAFTHAAYCSQTPWIFDGTIMDNIVHCSVLSTSRYDAVVAACGLRHEIRRMPLRDKTPVGSGGARLSGGQRKRVVWHDMT